MNLPCVWPGKGRNSLRKVLICYNMRVQLHTDGVWENVIHTLALRR